MRRSTDGVTLDGDAIETILRRSRTIAVLGIKPESRRELAAYWIPEYLASVGYEIVPVPVYYPEVVEILGTRVVRSLRELSRPDIVSVFRKPEHVAQHLDDLLALAPPVVWFQSGCLDLDAARTLSSANIDVVHDCIACRRAAIAPSTAPLDGQR